MCKTLPCRSRPTFRPIETLRRILSTLLQKFANVSKHGTLTRTALIRAETVRELILGIRNRIYETVY
jgi:hypothetical protein